MTSLPLHPAVVHLPLGLALIIPALAIAAAWAVWRGRVRPWAWIAVVALQALVVGAGLAAINTGEREEDRVERMVPRSAIHQHEEYAEQFVWAAGITLFLSGMALVFRKPAAARALTLAAVAGTFVVTAAAVRVGQAGGRLVYVHNAGRAYAMTAQDTPPADGDRARPRHADGSE